MGDTARYDETVGPCHFLWHKLSTILTTYSLDIGLRTIKYILLGLFLYAVGSLSIPSLRAFLEGPYGLVDDVKMLNFFRLLGLTGGAVVAPLSWPSCLWRTSGAGASAPMAR